jgi:hypothetical protein
MSLSPMTTTHRPKADGHKPHIRRLAMEIGYWPAETPALKPMFTATSLLFKGAFQKINANARLVTYVMETGKNPGVLSKRKR